MGIGSALIGGAASIIGGLIGADSSADAAEKNAQAQREFAQNGIRWKVADAKAAGIHPLYALGAPTTSFSPSYVGDNSLGVGIAEAGQNIGRAIDAGRTDPERVNAFNKTVQDLQLQRLGLENELLASQIAVTRSAGSPPGLNVVGSDPYLVEGQKQSGMVQVGPLERVSNAEGVPNVEAGAVTDIGYLRTKDGYMPVMSKDAKERLEDDWLGSLAWNWRNRLMPTIGYNASPPPADAPDGQVWLYDPRVQEYRLYPAGWTYDDVVRGYKK